MRRRVASVLLAVGSCVATVAVAGCQPATEDRAATVTAQIPVTTTDAPVHAAARHAKKAAQRKSTAPRRAGAVHRSRLILPDSGRTPGATNPAVTQATIRSTICKTGYTTTVRPSSSYTTALKISQLDSGYAFRGDESTKDYEEDHLIALELGGAPSDARNLWPEPYATSSGARTKDLVENQLHDLVCSGQVSLRTAQKAIATNWWRAYQRYGGRGVPTVYFGAYAGTRLSTSGGSTTTSTSTSTSTGATARCVDGTLSYSAHRSGTCSHHGGVAEWINPPPS